MNGRYQHFQYQLNPIIYIVIIIKNNLFKSLTLTLFITQLLFKLQACI